VKQLVLQGLGAGGHDHLATFQQRGHQVGGGFAHAGAGLQHDGAAITDGGLHGLAHLDLLVTNAVAIKGAGQRAAGRKQGGQVHGAAQDCQSKGRACDATRPVQASP